eukprot:gene16462-22683_t
MAARSHMLLLPLALLCFFGSKHADAAFLEELSLRPVMTTPMEIITEDAASTVMLSGRQAITVVYSRPVIALGSDFATADNAGGKVALGSDFATADNAGGKVALGSDFATADNAGGKPWALTLLRLTMLVARQTAVSRPVIALGSDFATADNAGGKPWALTLATADNAGGKIPFTLTCRQVPGKFRWVTTTIARWDVDLDWPTDLNCSLQWNDKLTSYDGMTVNLADVPPVRKFETSKLTMSLSTVLSDRAENVTGGMWDGQMGAPDDKLPEVPPDELVENSLGGMWGGQMGAPDDKLPEVPPDELVENSLGGMWGGQMGAPDDKLPEVPPDELVENSLGGMWGGQMGAPDDKLPEVPPDGRIVLNFNYPVKLDLLRDALVLSDRDSDIPITVRPCNTPSPWIVQDGLAAIIPPDELEAESMCAEVMVLGELARGVEYKLELPKGAIYNPMSGRVTIAQSTTIYGLRPFKLPFKAFADLSSQTDVLNDGVRYNRLDCWLPHSLSEDSPVEELQYNRLDCWLPHGLSENSPVEDLQSVISLCEVLEPFKKSSECRPLNFSLSLTNKATARVDVPGLMPKRKYNIYTESANVTDGFGLSLESSETSFWTYELSPFISTPEASPSYLIFEAGLGKAPLAWPFLTRMGNADAGENTVVKEAAAWKLDLGSEPDFDFSVFNLSSGTKPSVHVVHTCCNSYHYPPKKVSADIKVVIQNTISAAFTLTSLGMVAWVTSALPGGGPVKGAAARISETDYRKKEPVLIATCTTNAKGACSVSTMSATAGQYFTLVGVVTKGNNVAVVPDLSWFTSAAPTPYVGTIVLDRAVVKPGDDIHSGSFHIAIPVPPTASLVMSSLNVLHKRDIIASTIFTIADPRPPTADLALSLPAWTLPNSSIAVAVQATSYIGSAVGGMPMTLTWRSPRVQGIETITTEADGSGSTTIDLERLVQSGTITVAAAPRSLSLSLVAGAETILPGLIFSVQAYLNDFESGGPVKGTPVRVTLNLNGSETGSDSLAGACTREASCEIGSGESDIAGCQLLLPCMGHYVLEACTADSGETVCDKMYVGKNESEWATEPLATHTSFQMMYVGKNESEWATEPLATHTSFQMVVDKPAYSIGDDMVLTFWNYWSGASVMIMWGNDNGMRRSISHFLPSGVTNLSVLIGLPSGVTNLSVLIGQECTGGCTLMALLSVPRLGSSDFAPATLVPSSKLFDPLAPHQGSWSTHVSIIEDRTLDVSISIQSSALSMEGNTLDRTLDVSVSIQSSALSMDGNTLVLGPGQEFTITADVAFSGKPVPDAEVTVLVVDKAWIDLLPYPLRPELADELMAVVNTVILTGNQRVAPDAIANAFEAAVRRLGLDPWISPVTSIMLGNYWSGQADVDKSDAAFLANYAEQLTEGQFDFSGGCDFTSGYGRSGCITDRPMVSKGAGLSGGGMVEELVGAPGNMEGDESNGDDASTGDASGALCNMEGDESFGDDAGTGAGADGSTSQSAPSAPGNVEGDESNVDDAGTGADGSASQSAPRIAADFKATPIFSVFSTTINGTGSATYTTPDKFGTYIVRAYAADGGRALYGAAESSMIVRRNLSLTPSVPRFVRVGDEFEAGVIVTMSGSGTSTIQVTLRIVDVEGELSAIQATSNLTQILVLSGSQKEVRFHFSAVAIGSGTILISASDDMGSEDALQLELEVMAQQTSLQVATSFSLNASDPTSWQEGLQLPAAVPGSGGLILTAGVGYLPAEQALLSQMVDRYDHEFPEATTTFVLASIPSIYGMYSLAPSEDELANATSAVGDLIRLTSYLGLWYSIPRNGFRPTVADIVLNSWASWLADGLARSSRYYPGPYSASTTLPGSGRVKRFGSSRYYPGPYSDFYTLAWVRLALGWKWSPSTSCNIRPCATRQIVDDLSAERLLANVANSTNLPMRLLVALAMQEDDSNLSKNESSALSSILTATLGSLRVSGRTTYVSTYPGSQSAAGLSEQSLTLLLLHRARVPGTAQMVQKLASYVAQGQRTSLYGPLIISYSSMSLGLATKALSSYDLAAGSTTPDVQLSVSVPSMTLLEGNFTEEQNEVLRSITPWGALPSPPGEMTFDVNGSGEVSVVASLDFVPAEIITYPLYRGIWVESAIQVRLDVWSLSDWLAG